MPTASAVKTKYGFKAVIIRNNKSTLRATKCHETREKAIASAQLWIDQIEANSKKFQTPRQPVRIEPK